MTTNLQPNAVPAYPYDPTGEAASNKVTETHTLSVPNRGEFNYIIPRHSPFFNRSVSIIKLDTNETLVYGKDYLFGGSWPGAQLSTIDHEPLSGIIVFTDVTVRGNYKITYQTLGGEWVLDENQLIQVLRNRITNPFNAYWGDILGKPNEFPPAYHGHPAHGLDDYSDHIDAFNRLIDKLEEMVSRDIEDRPDYTQLIVSIINQGKLLNDILAQLDNHDEILKGSVQGQISAALARIKDTQAKATELVNDLDVSVDRKLNEKFDDQNNKLEALKTKLNQLIQQLGNDLEGRVSNVENNLNLQGKDFTKKINDLGHRIDNDIITNLNQLRTTLTNNLDTARNELSRDIRTKVDTINNRITQVINTIPDKFNPRFQSVIASNYQGLANKPFSLIYPEDQYMMISTQGQHANVSVMTLHKRRHIHMDLPLVTYSTNGIRGWNAGLVTRTTNPNGPNDMTLQGGMVADNENKEIAFPYNITENKTADDWYNLRANDFITHDGTHQLSQKLSLSGGTMTGWLKTRTLTVLDNTITVAANNTSSDMGIFFNRSTAVNNDTVTNSIMNKTDGRWQFRSKGNTIHLPAKSGTVALEGDMLPVGALVAFPDSVTNKPGFLLIENGTFDKDVYPDLYRALGNTNKLPNVNYGGNDIGMTAYFATDQIPDGWIAFDSIATTVTESNYPHLYRLLIAKYGRIQNVPKVEDRYLRNAGNGLRIGDLQGDAIRNITGSFWADYHDGVPYTVATKADGVFARKSPTGSYHSFSASDGRYTGYGIKLDASLQVPTANENRPKTLVMKLCIKATGGGFGNGTRLWIKAYGRVENLGTLNAEAIANSIQRLNNDKADKTHRHGISDIDGLDQRINTLLSSTRMQQYLAQNGWVKFPDGILIQWARASKGANREYNKFNWPIAFVEIYIATQSYTVSGEWNGDSNLYYNNEQFWGFYQTRLDVIGIGRWK